MKTFWAIIKLHEDETAQELLSAMFSKEEFNSRNAILIQENMALVEVFFERIPPKIIAEAIGGYSEVRCGFGEVSEECLKKAGMSLEQVYPGKADGGSPPVEPTGGADEEPPHDGGDGASGPEEDVPPAGPTGGTDEESPRDEGAGASGGEDAPPTGPASGADEEPPHDEDAPPTDPISRADEKPHGSKGAKTGKGRSAKRKAPDTIPEIDTIANTSTSYQQFAEKVIEWLNVEKRTAYLRDVFEVAAKVNKVSWTLIETELGKKGYNNPFAVRNPTSVEVTKKLAEKQIDCSFIALVEYVAKYKSYDFRSNIEKKVLELLREMGIEREHPELQREITDIAIAAVMAEPEKVNMRDICTAAGYGRDDDDILDAKMNFSNFINDFLRENGMDMMTVEGFIIGKLRKAIFTGSSMW